MRFFSRCLFLVQGKSTPLKIDMGVGLNGVNETPEKCCMLSIGSNIQTNDEKSNCFLTIDNTIYNN